MARRCRPQATIPPRIVRCADLRLAPVKNGCEIGHFRKFTLENFQKLPGIFLSTDLLNNRHLDYIFVPRFFGQYISATLLLPYCPALLSDLLYYLFCYAVWANK